MSVAQEDYSLLCQEYDFFKKIGLEGFETKIWLVFKALADGHVSMDSVAKNPCQSLMANNVPFYKIREYLEELDQNDVFTLDNHIYALRPSHSYELHRICYRITSNIENSHLPLDTIIRNCGYVYDDRNKNLTLKFLNGDINDKANTFRDFMTQLAFAGAKLLIKVVVHIEGKIPDT